MTVRVLANCATSLDGKLASTRRRQVRLSGPKDLARVHRLRQSVDAIAVGIGTVLADDPKLTVKDRYLPDGDEARRPLKVVLDSRCRTPSDAELLSTPGPVLLACADGREADVPGADVVPAGQDRVEIPRLLDVLADRGIESLLVEGGGEVLWSFLSGDHVDELTVYVAPVVLGGRDAPTLADGEGFDGIDEATRLVVDDVRRLDDGVLVSYVRK